MIDVDTIIKAIPPREWEVAFWPVSGGNALGWATGAIDVADVRRLVETISRVVREQAGESAEVPDVARRPLPPPLRRYGFDELMGRRGNSGRWPQPDGFITWAKGNSMKELRSWAQKVDALTSWGD